MDTENHAYQIALRTLKERCDHLQNKLESVEEENCLLKLQISQDDTRKPKSMLDLDQLQLQIALLTEQKTKLNHQVQLVTAENQKLWSRLSKLSSRYDDFEGKECLDGNVSYSDNHSDLEISKVTISPDSNRESLEEISLQLNTLVMEKTGVPAEYPSKIDLFVYKNSFQIENCAFSSSDNNLSLLSTIKDHISKLRQFKKILNNNKNDLACGINLLKNFEKSNLCNECRKTFAINCDVDSGSVNKLCGDKDKMSDLAILQVDELGLGTNELLVESFHKICPLCGVGFSGSDEEFHIHVNDHFSDNEQVSDNFEMLP